MKVPPKITKIVNAYLAAWEKLAGVYNEKQPNEAFTPEQEAKIKLIRLDILHLSREMHKSDERELHYCLGDLING